MRGLLADIKLVNCAVIIACCTAVKGTLDIPEGLGVKTGGCDYYSLFLCLRQLWSLLRVDIIILNTNDLGNFVKSRECRENRIILTFRRQS
jgi:hypothetical protein